MDDQRFDSLVRSFASGANRRQILKGVLGLGAGVAGAALTAMDDADAARRGFPGPRIFPCEPQCDGTSCGSNGCGGSCSCSLGCDCLADTLPDAPPETPRICVANIEWDPNAPCTLPEAACDPNGAFPTCEPVSGACVELCS